MFLTDDLNSQMGTFALLPQIVSAVKVPVIAAGGIATAGGVAAAMRLGAAGVQIGTAFMLCPEAITTPLHRAALKSPAAQVTALTNLFTGRPARSSMNSSYVPYHSAWVGQACAHHGLSPSTVRS